MTNHEYADQNNALDDADRARAIALGLDPDDTELVVFVACGYTVDEMAETRLGSGKGHENRITNRAGRHFVS